MSEENDSNANIQVLRRLFVNILIHCQVRNHKQFYLECKTFMKEDIIYKYKKLFKEDNVLKEYIQTDIGTELDDTLGDLYNNNDKCEFNKFASNSTICHLEKLFAGTK